MAAKRGHLTVADETAKPVKVKPKTLTEAVESGTYLEVLVAQRRQMVDDVKAATGPALAALHRQIALHSKEIAALQLAAAQEAAESVDEVADEAFDVSAL